ncbi:hypothetical protein NC653_006113 [Populus alba x Populus x berolinensis]|uniref:Argininosuccinate lyase n=1 Tax=Populus alba x Populus x berolinensis TaxID=444605 RepID=A0AAD6WC63_9ROSI|nr:hypothetical protein NC653_006113 [Populus alba x Populus x berolinensis]
MIGEPAKKLHTARSRNDQVLTDFKLWCRDAIDRIAASIKNLQVALVKLALNNEGLIVPGYTHLQRAQPVLLPHLLLAYVEQLERDAGRLLDCKLRMNFCPLGACALAGTGLPIDRFMTSEALGFTAPMRNRMGVVASEEFGFLTPSDSVSTGSSIMPQKKNPDPMELVRGKSARVIGDLVTLLTLCKGLPLAYNRDLQEDKEPVFDSVKTVVGMLEVSAEFAQNITFNRERIQKSLPAGHLDATTLADYLVNKGLPFRTAHEIVGTCVHLCVSRNLRLEDLTLDDLKRINPAFHQDVYEYLGVENAVNKFCSYGSTGSACVASQLDYWVWHISSKKEKETLAEAEDMELIDAVQKLGEGNWASIVRGEFKGDRTASQLSQRAARDAVKMALDPHPAAKSLIASSAGTKTPNNCVPPTFTAEASPAQHQSQQRTMMTKSSSIWPVGPAAKSQVMLAKASEKSILSSDPVRAAAVAAGARIATQSDAASLLKAAQAKNAVHIMPTGSSSIKSSMDWCGMATAPTTTRPAASGPFPGLPKATSPPPQMKASSSTVQHTQSTPVTSFNAQSEQTNSGLAKATVLPPQMKASSLTTQNTQSTPIMSLSTPSEQTIAESSPKQGIVTIKDTQAFGSQEVANSQVLKDGAHVSVKEPSEHFQEVKAALTNQEAELKSQVAVLEISNGSPKLIMNESGLVNVTGNQVNGSQNADDNKMTCSPIKEAENQSAVQENDQNQSVSERQADLPSSASNESCIKVDSISITEASDGMMDG